MKQIDVLQAFSLPFMEIDEVAWDDYCCELTWQEVLDQFDALVEQGHGFIDPEDRQALNALPTFEEHASYARRVYTGGLAQSALPVESLYVDPAAAIDNPADGPCYLQQTAYYMRDLAASYGLAIPNQLNSMPDHVSVELALAAILVDTANATQGNQDDACEEARAARAAARDFLTSRFNWLERYRAHLESIADIPQFYRALTGAVSVAVNALAESMQ